MDESSTAPDDPASLAAIRPGARFRSEPEVLTAEDAVWFGRRFGGGPGADPWLVAALTMRGVLASGLAAHAEIVGIGIDLRWRGAVRPGDRLWVEVEVVEARPAALHPNGVLFRVRCFTFAQPRRAVQLMKARLLALPSGPSESERMSIASPRGRIRAI